MKPPASPSIRALDGLQREDRGSPTVGARQTRIGAELREFEATREADHLQRLAADEDLVRFLQLSEFDTSTPEWGKFARALAEYGYAVFRAWLGTGEIVRRLAARTVRGRTDLPTPFHLHEDDVAELAAELMVRGITSFRAGVLLRGRWKADGGATLKTYFVGHVLFDVPSAYRQWRRASGREALFDPSEPPVVQPSSALPSTDRAELRMLLDDVCRRLPDDERTMFERQADGWTIAQIAHGLDMSEAKVKTVMMRSRERIARLYPGAHQWIS